MVVVIAVSLLFTLAYCILYIAVLYAWNRPLVQNQVNRTAVKASIIVCARNEERNIEACIKSLINADNADTLEYIFVDDASDDETREVILKHSSINQKVKLISLPKRDTLHPKRDGLMAAASAAQGDLLIFTDADCTVSPGWISSIIMAYQQGHDFISGPIVYKDEPGVFAKLQALHYMTLQGLGGASCIMNQPIMCSGANLAIKKTLFNELITSPNYISGAGEDMWLLEARKKNNGTVHFVKDRNAIVTTNAEPTINGFFWQQQRWAIKNKRYKDFGLNFSMAVIGGHFIFLLISLILSCFYGKFANLIGIQFIVQLLVDYVCWMCFSIFFERKKLMWNFLSLQIVRFPFYLVIGCSILINRFSWKGRALN